MYLSKKKKKGKKSEWCECSNNWIQKKKEKEKDCVAVRCTVDERELAKGVEM